LRLEVIILRQIKVVHREEKIRGVREILRRNRRIGEQTRLGESQRDLAAGIVEIPLPDEDLRDRQANSDAVSGRNFQRAREPLHGCILIP